MSRTQKLLRLVAADAQDAVASHSPSPAVILEQARRAGVEYTNGLAKWLSDHHPDQAAEVIELARNTGTH